MNYFDVHCEQQVHVAQGIHHRDGGGSNSFTIKSVRNETFDVTLTVTDAAGHSASATQSVTE